MESYYRSWSVQWKLESSIKIVKIISKITSFIWIAVQCTIGRVFEFNVMGIGK